MVCLVIDVLYKQICFFDNKHIRTFNMFFVNKHFIYSVFVLDK